MALSSTPGSLFVLFSLQAASQSNLSGKHLASVAQWATPGPVGGFFRSPHTFSVSLCVYFPLYLSIWTSFSLWLGCGLFKTGPSGRLRRQVWACVYLAGALLRWAVNAVIWEPLWMFPSVRVCVCIKHPSVSAGSGPHSQRCPSKHADKMQLMKQF